MVHHMIMWNLKPELAEEEKVRLRAEMSRALLDLKGKVPGLLTCEVVEQTFPASSHEMALFTSFENEADLKTYAVHPDHVKVVDEYIRPYTCDRVKLDYEK